MIKIKNIILVNTKTQKEYRVGTREYADLMCRWGKKIGLVYTDMECIAIGMNGEKYLIDECGNYGVLPNYFKTRVEV